MHNTEAAVHVQAVVIGGGYAGLLAAAAVTRHGCDVLILDDGGSQKEGPADVLWPAGQEPVDYLFYGGTRALVQAGAARIPIPERIRPHIGESSKAIPATAQGHVITSAPELTQSVLRELLLHGLVNDGYTEISVKDGVKVVGLLGDSSQVRGVRVQPANGPEYTITATLVIDCGGQQEQTVDWLRALGVPSAPQGVRGTRAGHITHPHHRLNGMKRSLRGFAGRRRGNRTVRAVEASRWIAAPTAGHAAKHCGEHSLESLASYQGVGDLIRQSVGGHACLVEMVDVQSRRYYEKVKSWPAGFVAIGAAVADFDPATGHGLTAAAESVLALRQEMACGGLWQPTLARRTQRRIGRYLDTVWDKV